jgi:DNA-directed RNA polymerase alpha subunit
MKNLKSLSVIILSLITISSLTVTSLGETQQTNRVPITISIVNSTKMIDVTMPVVMPISIMDGKVLTADNVEITNNSDSIPVEITSVEVDDGAYEVASYDEFVDYSKDKIALIINGCKTVDNGIMDISAEMLTEKFPVIDIHESLPINYSAKVSKSTETGIIEEAASVVFTLKTVD